MSVNQVHSIKGLDSANWLRAEQVGPDKVHTCTITLRLRAHVNRKCVHVKQRYHVTSPPPNLHAVLIFWVQELTTRTSVELCNQTHLYLSRHTPSGQVATTRKHALI